VANKAEILLENITQQCGKATYNTLVEKFGIIEDKLTPAKQAKYIKDLLDEVIIIHGLETAEKVLRPGGYHCISDKVIKTAKALYQNSKDLEDFIKLLNDNQIGGGQLHMENNIIIGIYDRCYCGIPKAAKDISTAYCECSAGWFEKLFSEVFEKEVFVKKRDTILNGAKECIFEIMV
jgi:predicted hydrocarbon binding protein